MTMTMTLAELIAKIEELDRDAIDCACYCHTGPEQCGADHFSRTALPVMAKILKILSDAHRDDCREARLGRCPALYEIEALLAEVMK